MHDSDEKAIKHLKLAVASGKHWYLALLEAIGLWASTGENSGVYNYRYLIDNEAFNWLILAERLTREVREAIPDQELVDLFFFDKAPLEIDVEEFRRLIGEVKYTQNKEYAYQGLKELLEYMALIKQKGKYVDEYQNLFRKTCKIKGCLFLDYIDDLQLNLRKDSPINVLKFGENMDSIKEQIS